MALSTLSANNWKSFRLVPALEPPCKSFERKQFKPPPRVGHHPPHTTPIWLAITNITWITTTVCTDFGAPGSNYSDLLCFLFILEPLTSSPAAISLKSLMVSYYSRFLVRYNNWLASICEFTSVFKLHLRNFNWVRLHVGNFFWMRQGLRVLLRKFNASIILHRYMV